MNVYIDVAACHQFYVVYVVYIINNYNYNYDSEVKDSDACTMTGSEVT